MGQLRDIRWTWESRDNDTRTAYVAVDGRMSLADLIAELATLAPGVPPDEVMLNWATVVWHRPATAEELEHRRRQRELIDARHDRGERETYDKLHAKYGRRP